MKIIPDITEEELKKKIHKCSDCGENPTMAIVKKGNDIIQACINPEFVGFRVECYCGKHSRRTCTTVSGAIKAWNKKN